jgi:ATP-dependent exoDNAse (exonuclease V) beta subunit
MPINYKKDMAESHFSAHYYREQVLAHIDSANMFYVAVTRAEQELHLMTSSNPRDGRGSVGNLLRQVLGITEDFMEWGEPLHPTQSAVSPAASLRSYPTSRPGAKLRLRLPSSRYTEDEVSLSPRDYGVLMHRAFENAAGAKDVYRALDRMVLDALISPSEHAHLKEIIERAFANPLVAGWFSEEWEAVRNEGNILMPAHSGMRRPDRVMMRGERAVVVDYKFGHNQPSAHANQLRDYVRLLGEMGYTDVEGYLWYVSLDHIEKN